MRAKTGKNYPKRFLLLAVAGLLLLSQWTDGVAFRADFARLFRLAETRYGAVGRRAIEDWQLLLNRAAGKSRNDQLTQVNQFVNRRVLFAEDQDLWGQKDYWATPLEALGRGLGDCEDSAFTKYVSMLQLGIPDDQLRLIYVRVKIDGVARAHMVLSYYPSPKQEPLILDSLSDDILPPSRRADLFPVFSFNASGLWVSGKKSSVARPSARLSNWRSVLLRMQEEGWN